MTEPGRAEHELDIPVGLVVHDATGHPWVACGWLRNTAGRFPFFTKDLDDVLAVRSPWNHLVHTYYASVTETLVRKFPDLAERRKE